MMGSVAASNDIEPSDKINVFNLDNFFRDFN